MLDEFAESPTSTTCKQLDLLQTSGQQALARFKAMNLIEIFRLAEKLAQFILIENQERNTNIENNLDSDKININSDSLQKTVFYIYIIKNNHR